MLETELLTESLILMVIGMGTVFSFLLLLVLLLRVMSWLAHRMSPLDAQTPLSTPMAPVTGPVTGQMADAELIAVITAAVTRYRARWRP
ncbi:MAG: OadG family protein [Halochromatium sp.]|uniref:OadG family protein n=1 Tax=Halochromatium sp. TaxID=2049430 RepID=UPI00397BDB1C